MTRIQVIHNSQCNNLIHIPSNLEPSPKKTTPRQKSEIEKNVDFIINEETKAGPPGLGSDNAVVKQTPPKENQFGISREVEKHKIQGSEGLMPRPKYYYSLQVRE